MFFLEIIRIQHLLRLECTRNAVDVDEFFSQFANGANSVSFTVVQIQSGLNIGIGLQRWPFAIRSRTPINYNVTAGSRQ